jgi:UDP-glucose 4-epimerase
VIPIFAHRMLHNQPLTIYGDGEQTRDFVNVTDVALANLRAAKASGVSGAFNVASGESVTVNQLVALMSEAGQSAPAVEHGRPRPGDVRHSRADISKAREAFGYEPTIGLCEGLVEYMGWARSELL